MTVQFIEVSSRKLLKELYLTGYILQENDTTIIIDDKCYFIVTSEFDANKIMLRIYLRKSKCSKSQK